MNTIMFDDIRCAPAVLWILPVSNTKQQSRRACTSILYRCICTVMEIIDKLLNILTHSKIICTSICQLYNITLGFYIIPFKALQRYGLHILLLHRFCCGTQIFCILFCRECFGHHIVWHHIPYYHGAGHESNQHSCHFSRHIRSPISLSDIP